MPPINRNARALTEEVRSMAFDDIANTTVRQAMDQGREAAETAKQAISGGYDAAQEYVRAKGFDFDMRDFVRREPWIAIAAAFAVGYVAAQIIRRVS
jgi:ElaB/YqjD/DUF883 family membrane-anchored ribosome-binding protein